ncbi:MAG: hypothetical protein JJT96_17960 [Opitutales bacterium]|nr:hypothetical protein [Opitutales bacterium]
MQILIGAVVGFLGVILFTFGSAALDLESPTWTAFGGKLIGGVVLSVALHEAGHVFAGWWMRYNFFSVSVGPLVLRNVRGRLRLRLELRGLNVLGGLTIMFPKSGDPSRKATGWFIGAGPLASLSAFLLLAGWAALLQDTSGILAGWTYFIWLTAVLSLAIGLMSLIPEDSGGLQSDGAYLLKLIKGDAAIFPPQGIQQLFSLSISGVRPRDLPAVLLTQPNACLDANHRIIIAMFLYTHHLDKGETEMAMSFLDDAVDQVAKAASPLLKPAVFLEKAFAEAFFGGDPEIAAVFLEQGSQGYSEKITLKRAQAAIFLAQGKMEKARMAATEALAELPRHFDAGGVQLDEDLLHKLLRRVDE